MATKVIMPQLGESVVEGTVSRWLKGVGDRIEEYEPLLEVSTDKVDTEIPAPAAGVVLAIYVPEGTTVERGALLAMIGEAGEAHAGCAYRGDDAAAPEARVRCRSRQPSSRATMAQRQHRSRDSASAHAADNRSRPARPGRASARSSCAWPPSTAST